MQVDVVDKRGNKIEKITLDNKVFKSGPYRHALLQYLRAYLSNQRQGTSSSKTRSEVSGSGKKPWRQKGTGRARVGTKRNPIWRKGGAAHGPIPKSWRLNTPKKVKIDAMKEVLSQKFRLKKVMVLDNISIKSPKTKDFVSLIKGFGVDGKIMIVLDKPKSEITKSARNVPNVQVSTISNLNPYQLLNVDNVIFLKEALLSLEARYK